MIKKFLAFGSVEGLAKLFNFGLLTLIPLIVSKNTFGKLSLIFAIEIIISGIFLLGIDRAILRFLKEREEHHSDIFTSYVFFWFKKTWILFLGLPIGLFFSFRTIEITEIVLLMVLIFLSCLRQLKICELRVNHKVRDFFYLRLIVQVLKLVFVLIFLCYQESIQSYLIASIFAMSPVIYFLLKDLKIKSIFKIERLNKEYSDKVFKYGIPLAVHTLAGSILMLIDRFMIDEMINKEELAVYTLGYAYGASISFVFAVGNIFFEPILIRFKNNEVNNREVSLQQYSSLLYFLGAIFSIIFILMFPIIIDIFYTDGYKGATSIAIIVLLAHLLNPIYFQSNYRLMNVKKTKQIAAITILISIINIGLNIFFVREYGIFGAALSTFIAYCILVSSMYFLSLRISNFKITRNQWVYYLSNNILIVTGLFFMNNIFVLMAIFSILIVMNIKNGLSSLFKPDLSK